MTWRARERKRTRRRLRRAERGGMRGLLTGTMSMPAGTQSWNDAKITPLDIIRDLVSLLPKGTA